MINKDENLKDMFISKQDGFANNDLEKMQLEDYLRVTEGFKSSFPEFNVKEVNGFNVMDESESCEVGYKARSGEFFISQLAKRGVKEIVYVQPRRGFAGISLSWLCKKYGLNLTLVMPSSKIISPHQALCIELGAKPMFVRIAAMPNANSIAKKYAEHVGAFYVPLGLAHPLVTAGGVRSVYDFFKDKEKPKTMWTVISTGVLSRTLQIALPDTEFKAIGVARNISHGELGRAEFASYHKPFNSKSDLVPTAFDCEPSYDSKGWDYLNRYGNEGDWFFSVAGSAPESKLDVSTIHSERAWRDYSDFEAYGMKF